MSTYRFKTNIKCGGCIAAVTPYLSNLEGLDKWSVDLSDPDRIMTAEVTGLTPDDIISTIQKSGYVAKKVD